MSNNRSQPDLEASIRKSNLRIGLVVQGGVMRTVYAVGALAEMERLGTRRLIKGYSGSSGGALAMTVFATGNAQKGESLFLDTLANKRFINARRIHPIVDIDYMVREVISGQIIANLHDELRELPPCLVALTSAETGLPRTARIDGPNPIDDPLDVLCATTAIPILYGKKVEMRDGQFVDGGITDPVPLVRLLSACDLDAVVVLLTRPVGSSRGRTPVERAALHLDRRISRPLRRSLLAPNALYTITEAALEAGHLGGVPIWTISPSDPDNLVERTSVDHDALMSSAAMGAADTRATIQELITQLAAPTPKE